MAAVEDELPKTVTVDDDDDVTVDDDVNTVGMETGVAAGDGVGGMDWLLPAAAIELPTEDTDPSDDDKSLLLLLLARPPLPFVTTWSIEFISPLLSEIDYQTVKIDVNFGFSCHNTIAAIVIIHTEVNLR